ncbi:hypothetical protein LRP88_14987 [Fusarium phalaenopsidis]
MPYLDHVAPVNAEGPGRPARPEERLNELSVLRYGTLRGSGGAQPRGLVSAFLGDFHKVNKASGSAPTATSYWMGSRTSGMLAVPVLWEPWTNPWRVNKADAPAGSTFPDGLTCEELSQFKCKYSDRFPAYNSRWRQPFEGAGINWGVLEQVLNSPPGHRISLRMRSLAVWYAPAFFIPTVIGGCGAHQRYYVGDLDRTHRAYNPRQRLDTHLQMASHVRLDGRRRSVCFTALFRPASEGTFEGWARKQAGMEHFREAFGCWISKAGRESG